MTSAPMSEKKVATKPGPSRLDSMTRTPERRLEGLLMMIVLSSLSSGGWRVGLSARRSPDRILSTRSDFGTRAIPMNRSAERGPVRPVGPARARPDRRRAGDRPARVSAASGSERLPGKTGPLRADSRQEAADGSGSDGPQRAEQRNRGQAAAPRVRG